MKRKSKIFKDGKEVGWAKSDYGAINNVINSCFQHKFDITLFEVRDYFTDEVLWKGADYINSMKAQEQP